jgi:hypothetical protein
MLCCQTKILTSIFACFWWLCMSHFLISVTVTGSLEAICAWFDDWNRNNKNH